MLTPPKWHAAWLKSQYYAVNTSNKTIFSKPSDRMFDDLSKCCNSPSKELTIEALKCWRIWIDNQQHDDWKQNEICYSAVQPLLTKKFHSLYKDVEVSEMKLNLMWLIIQKTQHLIHLEGPQHVLEVFIQSCISWLSCFEENDSHFQDLILKLLCNLFSKEVKIEGRGEKFPSLTSEILKSNKLFCRLVNRFIEIFLIWSKIKDKAELLNIWNHFLDHCERCFKYIPVTIWHNIFKLANNVCANEKELIKNKIALLHKCAVSLKSVMSNSKFIDCSQFLTTPAEALLKILIELCMNCRDENIDFEIFLNCQDICYTLCNRTVDALDHEFCLHLLGKIECIEVKPLLWGIWCGITKHFNEQLNVVAFEQFNKMEMHLFRKLRAVAVNFDLDKPFLQEKSFPLIESCFNFLKLNNTCVKCLCRNDTTEQNFSEDSSYIEFSNHMVKDSSYNFDGNFNSDLMSYINDSIGFLKIYGLEKNIIFKRTLTVRKHFSTLAWRNLSCSKEQLEIAKCEYSQKKDTKRNLYLQHNFSLMRSIFRIFKPFAIHFENRACNKSKTLLYIKIALETLSIRLQFSVLLDRSIIATSKDNLHKKRQGRFFPLRKFIYSYGKQENIKLFSGLVLFCAKTKFLYDIDFCENLNYSCIMNGSLPLTFVLLFVIMYINHKSADDNEEVIVDHIKWFQGKEYPSSVRVATLAKSIINCKGNEIKNDLSHRASSFRSINEANVIAKNSEHFSKIPCKINDHEEENVFIHDMIRSFKHKILSDDLNILQNVDELENKNNSSTIDSSKKIKDMCVREKIAHNPRTFRRREGNGITKYFLRKKNLNMSYSFKGSSSDKKVVNNKNSKESLKEKVNASLNKNRINRTQIDSIYVGTGKRRTRNNMRQNVEKSFTKSSSFDGARNKSKDKCKKESKLKDCNLTSESRKTNKNRKSNRNVNKKLENTREKIEQIETQRSFTRNQKATQQKNSYSEQNEISKDKFLSLRKRPLQRPSKFDNAEWPIGNGKMRRKNFDNTVSNSSKTNVSTVENKNLRDGRRNVSEQNRSRNFKFLETSLGKETENFTCNKLAKTSKVSLSENWHFENNDIDIECTNFKKQNSVLDKKDLPASDNEKFELTTSEEKEKFHSYGLSQTNGNNKRRKNLKRKNCTSVDNLRNSTDFSVLPHVHAEIEETVNALVNAVEKWETETLRFQNNVNEEENLGTIMNDALIENIKCEDSSELNEFLSISKCISLAESESSNFSSEKLINNLDDMTNGMKLKLEDICSDTESYNTVNNIGKIEESLIREENGKSVVGRVTGNTFKLSESVGDSKIAKPSVQKFEPNVIHNRGSRMLALISDSPKIEHFHDSSPSSKQQAKKPPNVNKNSRASKMLALLPELRQENTSNFECNLIEEVFLEKCKDAGDDGNRSVFGSTFLPNISGSSNIDSPKLSQSLLQRKSIRFDDEKNETVTYFTDSPPCQIIKKGMTLRSSERNFEYSK